MPRLGVCQARHLRAQPALFLRGGGHFFHQVDVAFVGRVDVERGRPQVGVTGFFKHHRFGDVAQAQPAHFFGCVGCEQAGRTCARHQLLAQVCRRAVQAVAWVAFERDHLFGDELPGALAQGCNVRWDVEVHGRVFWNR